MEAGTELPPRLAGYPRIALRSARLEVRVARTFRARLLGLAGLRGLPRDCGLLLPATRSAHTLGMRFALDLVWLDRRGNVVRIDSGVVRGRLRSCRAAAGLLELAGGQAAEAELVVGGHALSPGAGTGGGRGQ